MWTCVDNYWRFDLGGVSCKMSLKINKKLRDVLILLCLAWICESIMDTIKHHQHSSWLFALPWPEKVMVWLESDWTLKRLYLFNLYDGWHTFKGLMLLFQAGAIWRLSNWKYALLYLASFLIIHEGLYGWILLW